MSSLLGWAAVQHPTALGCQSFTLCHTGIQVSQKCVSCEALKCNDTLWAVYMNNIGMMVTDMNMIMFIDKNAKDERMHTCTYSMAGHQRGWSAPRKHILYEENGIWFYLSWHWMASSCMTSSKVQYHQLDLSNFFVSLWYVYKWFKLSAVQSWFAIAGSTNKSLSWTMKCPCAWQLCNTPLGQSLSAHWDWSTYVLPIYHYCIILYDRLLTTIIVDCWLLFLLPYSPDYNPIEEAFASVKAWMWCHNDDHSLSSIGHTLYHITPEMATGWCCFKLVGYCIYNKWGLYLCM